MPAKSEAQRRMMALARAYKRGEHEGEVSDEVKRMADEMSDEELTDFMKKESADLILSMRKSAKNGEDVVKKPVTGKIKGKTMGRSPNYWAQMHRAKRVSARPEWKGMMRHLIPTLLQSTAGGSPMAPPPSARRKVETFLSGMRKKQSDGGSYVSPHADLVDRLVKNSASATEALKRHMSGQSSNNSLSSVPDTMPKDVTGTTDVNKASTPNAGWIDKLKEVMGNPNAVPGKPTPTAPGTMPKSPEPEMPPAVLMSKTQSEKFMVNLRKLAARNTKAINANLDLYAAIMGNGIRTEGRAAPGEAPDRIENVVHNGNPDHPFAKAMTKEQSVKLISNLRKLREGART